MGNTKCWMAVFQLKNFITDKCTKEIYNIHVASVFIKPEFKILKCRPELENIEVGKYINAAFQNKIKYMDHRKLAEFNYKIINNILINKPYLSKWISETNAKKKIPFIYYTIVLSMITFGKLLAIVYNLTLHSNVLGYYSKLKNVNVNSIN